METQSTSLSSHTTNPTNDNNVQVIPFCVPLPLHSAPIVTGETSSSSSSFGVVGTITLRGQSAVVWLGWGSIEAVQDGEPPNYSIVRKNPKNGMTSVGNGKPPMGSISLSMPPPPHRHASKLDATPTSQLLGGSSEEDMILGQQISARLAKRIGWPIFVSCSFSGWGGDSMGGGASGAVGGGGEMGGMMSDDSDMLSSPALSAGYDDSLPQQASALAEREVGRILLEEKKRIGGVQ